MGSDVKRGESVLATGRGRLTKLYSKARQIRTSFHGLLLLAQIRKVNQVFIAR